MTVTLRKFERRDIPRKVAWINDSRVNRFLHYDLPLTLENTERWFERNSGRQDRFDAVIEADGAPVGLAGFLAIDPANRRAELYIALGEAAFRGRGAARRAVKLLLEYGFDRLGLHRVYLFTELNNVPARRLFETVGFSWEGVLRDDALSRGALADRAVYGLLKEEWRA